MKGEGGWEMLRRGAGAPADKVQLCSTWNILLVRQCTYRNVRLRLV